MARSLRSSRLKFNKTKLRSKVYQPVEDARIERLSAKLLEVASRNHADDSMHGIKDVTHEADGTKAIELGSLD